ncbi:MAG: glycoside hydrolase, partial [Acidobacteriota bacterium]|nr:glycoside hydrolase [Acidobacteriota bacterium]
MAAAWTAIGNVHMIPMKLHRGNRIGFCLLFCLSLALGPAGAQTRQPVASVPVFTGSFTAGGKQYQYTVAGRNPALGGTTVIPVTIVPVALSFDGFRGKSGKDLILNGASEAPKVVRSPIFQKYKFATGYTQYGDAVQRAEFYKELKGDSKPWHTLLGRPRVLPALEIRVPASDGYMLTSRRTGHSLAVVDLEAVKKEFFQSLRQRGADPRGLVIALSKNTMFYPLNDATVCCSWGAYGAQLGTTSSSAQAFILGTYLDPGVVPRYSDIQTLSEQIAQWMNDPLQGYRSNVFPPWRMPAGNAGCGGSGVGTFYRFAGPADSPSVSNATRVTLNGAEYHLENAALLPWFAEDGHPATYASAFSFPNIHALTEPAQPCLDFRRSRPEGFNPSVNPVAETNPPNGHELIGYWAGYPRFKTVPLRDVSPQWDVVIVAFAPPAKGSKSLMVFQTPAGYTDAQFKSDIAYLQSKGKKVLISLGGGGQVVTLNTAEDVRDFVTSVSAIVEKYNFNGVDLDFETPSLILDPGDADFRHPTTPSVVNLIAAMHQLRDKLGPGFMI